MANDRYRSYADATFGSSPSPNLQEQIMDLEYGDHSCILYNTVEQQMRVAIPFFRKGFEQGDHCLYVVNEQSIEDVQSRFEEAGIDVEARKQCGALSFESAEDTFLRSGSFSVEEMLDFVDDHIDSIGEDGFSGFRSAGEMSWVLQTDTSPEEMVEYEARLNEIIRDRWAILLCQYNDEKFPADIVQKILATHPIAVVEDLVCSNPFYEPPELLLEDSDDEQLVEWRIRQLEDYRRSQELLDEKESLLKEIHHRVKNNMQVINSFLAMQSRNVESDEAHRAFRESMRRIRAMALVHEKLYQTSDRSTVDFEQYLRNLVGNIAGSSGLSCDVSVTVEVDDSTLDPDRCITCGLIVNELVSNSLQHGLESTGDGAIDVTFRETDSDGKILSVQDNGRGFVEDFDPDQSGSTGLDIVGSLVGYELDGTIEFENDNGARVTVTF